MEVYNINVSSIPSQQFSFIHNNNEYQVKLKSVNNKLYMNVSRNGDVIFKGLRVDANYNLFTPFDYKEVFSVLGISNVDEQPPKWERLGKGDLLYYAV